MYYTPTVFFVDPVTDHGETAPLPPVMTVSASQDIGTPPGSPASKGSKKRKYFPITCTLYSTILQLCYF